MKRAHLAILLVAMVALSGCAALDGGDTDDSGNETKQTDAAAAEFTHEVTFAWAGVAGDPVGVEVTVENTGSEQGTHEATLRTGGETVASKSVTLSEGGTETVMLTHTFEEAGEYSLAVGESETTVDVYQSPMTAISETEFERETRVSEERISADGVMVRNGTEFDIQLNETSTVRTNYDEQTQYTAGETETNFVGITSNETSEEWIVNGTAYTKSQSEGEDQPTYESEPSDEFEDDQSISNLAVLQYLSVEASDEEYVLRFDPETPEQASELWAAFGDDEEISPGSISELTMEYHVDAELFRPSRLVFNASFQEYDVFSTLDMTVVQEPVAYGEPVEVEVPEEVRENTTAQ
jgi:hypothetical protein